MEDSAQIEGADGADSDVKGKAIDEASGTCSSEESVTYYLVYCKTKFTQESARPTRPERVFYCLQLTPLTSYPPTRTKRAFFRLEFVVEIKIQIYLLT